MVIELPETLEAALIGQAAARGITPIDYVCEVLSRDLAGVAVHSLSRAPRKTSRGILAAYGPAPSAEEIDEARQEMFRGFGEHL